MANARSLLLLVAVGCTHKTPLPPAVRDRPAFTAFNPAGAWQTTGQALRQNAPTVSLAVSLAPGRKTFDIAGPDVQGHALVDGDWVYTVTSSDLPATALFLYTRAGDAMDGLRATKVVAYQHAVRAGAATGDPFAGTWSIEGIKDDGGSYKGELVVTKVGDHYSLTGHAGKSRYEGMGFVAGDKLVAAMLTTERVKTQKKLVGTGVGEIGVEKSTHTTFHIADYVLGAYQHQGNSLRGSSLGIADNDQLVPVEWTQPGAAPAAPAPAPAEAPAP